MIRCLGGEAELLEDYEMLGFLGKGGFGTVQRARHKATGLLRAVKKIPCGNEHGEEPTAEQWGKIFVEVEALMELVHPNIVRLHAYYQGRDALYLVEELCSGGTLEQRLKQRGGRLEAPEAAVVLPVRAPESALARRQGCCRGPLRAAPGGAVARLAPPGGWRRARAAAD